MIRILWTLFLIATLTACTSITPSTPSAPPSTLSWKEREAALNRIQNWHLSGKVGVIAQHNSGSASLNWTQQQNHYTISLVGPLGAGGLTLDGRPGSVTMETADGKHATAQSPEKLIAQQWGWQLPVSQMKYWIRGLPAPDAPSQSQFDAYHRLSSISQLGFNVQFLSYYNLGSLSVPDKISITSPSIKVKIIVHQWKI